MKNRVKRFALGVLVSVVAAFSPATLFAAAGDLYSGGLSSRNIVKFTPTSPPTKTTFVSGIFADPLAFDAKGNLFVGNTETNTIIKINPSGTQSPFANGLSSFGLAFDGSGILYATDSLSHRLLKFTPDGTMTPVATFAAQPFGVTVDPDGNQYVSLTNNTIIKISPGGTQTPFATGLSTPEGLASDALGNIYVADFASGSVFKFSPSGTRTTFTTGLTTPRQLTLDSAGNVFVAVHSTQQILKFGPSGGAPTVFASSTNAGGLAFEPPTAQLANISTRASVKTGAGVTIAGFIVTGTAPKQVLVRGMGPFLTQHGVSGVLADPTLDLHNSTSSIATNDDWQTAANSNQIPVNLRPTDPRESAILITLQPGNYTAILAGKNGTTGIGLVEVYDLSPSAFSELTNVSTRGFVGTGPNVMIGGIITSGGNGVTQVIVRGLGPSLTQHGVSGALADPTLELHDVNGTLLASNNNWRGIQQAEIQATGMAPQNDLESALVVTLPAGQYTAILAGNGGGTGIGLVEVFKLR
jgi:streptogramin lyase